MNKRSVAAVFLAAGLSLGFSQIAEAAVVPSPSFNAISWPSITGSNLMCLDDPGGSAQAGQFLELWSCHGGTNQRWQFIPVGTDANGRPGYLIQNPTNHLCVAIGFPIEKNPPPSNVFQSTCNTTPIGSADIWIVLDNNPTLFDHFELEHATLASDGSVFGSGDCVTALSTNDANGTGISWGRTCTNQVTNFDQTQDLKLR